MTCISIDRRKVTALPGFVAALSVFAIAVGGLTAALPALAQTSGQPMRVILPVGPGSGVDTIVRVFGNALTKELSQPVVIENQPGAGGVIGTQALVKAAPDGRTIGIVSNNHVVFPSVYKNLPFDPIEDITPIMVIGETPFVLAANPQKVPASNVKDVIAAIKAKPADFNYGSSGNGTILHHAAAMFFVEAGVEVNHVPYKGVGPMVTDLIGGRIDFAVVPVPVLPGHLKSGALKAIGTTTSARATSLPDLPTIAEQGMPNYAVGGWFAAVGPAKLPAAEVKRIHAALTAALATPEVKETLVKQGHLINPGTPEAAAQFFRSELAKYGALAKKIGLTAQ
jgi:tripartite-type tricarboxylate transporter receptor subunit TctC